MSSEKISKEKQPVGAPRTKVGRYSRGGKVRAARDRKQWDQPELARRSGIHQSNISRIETNQLKPERDTWISLGEALDTDFGIGWLREYRKTTGLLIRYYKALPDAKQQQLIDVARDFFNELMAQQEAKAREGG